MFYKTSIILIIAVNILASAPVFAAVADFGAPVVETFRAFGQTRQGFITFLGWLFPLMLATATIIAVLSLIWAGFEWMAGAVSPPQIESAQKRIWAAVSGLALALGSWLILNTINPDLLSLRTPAAFEKANEFCASGGCQSWDEILGFGEAFRGGYSSAEEAWTDARKKTEDWANKIPNVTEQEAKKFADNSQFYACAQEVNKSDNPPENCKKLVEESCERGRESQFRPGKTLWNCSKATAERQKEENLVIEKAKQSGWVCRGTRSTSSYLSSYIGQYTEYLNDFVGCKK